MNLNETTTVEGPAPPEPLFSDYIEMIYLSFVISVGIPTNAIILRKLFLELKRAPKDSVKVNFWPKSYTRKISAAAGIGAPRAPKTKEP